MSEQFTQIWKFIVSKWQEIDEFLISQGISLTIVVLSLALLAAILLLIRYSMRISKRETFSLLVSKGEIRQGIDFDPLLSLRVSNLNAFPVQVLEISLDSQAMTMPVIVELGELVAANEAIPIELELEQNLVGETGYLNLFAYLPKKANKLYRLKADYAFEPWAGRYKISPLKQKIKRVRQLDSQRLSKTMKSPLNTKLLERSSSNIKAIKEPEFIETQTRPTTPKGKLSHTDLLNQRPSKSKPVEIRKPLAKPTNPTDLLEQVANGPEKPKTKTDLKFPNEF